MSFGPLFASSASSFTRILCSESFSVLTNLAVSLPDQVIHEESVVIRWRNFFRGVRCRFRLF